MYPVMTILSTLACKMGRLALGRVKHKGKIEDSSRVASIDHANQLREYGGVHRYQLFEPRRKCLLGAFGRYINDTCCRSACTAHAPIQVLTTGRRVLHAYAICMCGGHSGVSSAPLPLLTKEDP
eukprot:648865-Prorocentrum_minimum.AAC.2